MGTLNTPPACMAICLAAEHSSSNYAESMYGGETAHCDFLLKGIPRSFLLKNSRDVPLSFLNFILLSRHHNEKLLLGEQWSSWLPTPPWEIPGDLRIECVKGKVWEETGPLREFWNQSVLFCAVYRERLFLLSATDLDVYTAAVRSGHGLIGLSMAQRESWTNPAALSLAVTLIAMDRCAQSERRFPNTAKHSKCRRNSFWHSGAVENLLIKCLFYAA